MHNNNIELTYLSEYFVVVVVVDFKINFVIFFILFCFAFTVNGTVEFS